MILPGQTVLEPSHGGAPSAPGRAPIPSHDRYPCFRTFTSMVVGRTRRARLGAREDHRTRQGKKSQPSPSATTIEGISPHVTSVEQRHFGGARGRSGGHHHGGGS